MNWLKDRLQKNVEREERHAELRLVYGDRWQQALTIVEQTSWLRAPGLRHSAAVQLGKAGVSIDDLTLAMNLVHNVVEAARYHVPREWSRDTVLDAAEFVGTMNALGCLTGSTSAFHAALNVLR